MLISFLTLGQSAWDRQVLRKKRSLFGLTIPELQATISWPFALALDGLILQVGAPVTPKWLGSKKRERKRPGFPYPLGGQRPKDLTSSLETPPPEGCPSHVCHRLGTQPSPQGFWGTVGVERLHWVGSLRFWVGGYGEAAHPNANNTIFL